MWDDAILVMLLSAKWLIFAVQPLYEVEVMNSRRAVSPLWPEQGAVGAAGMKGTRPKAVLQVTTSFQSRTSGPTMRIAPSTIVGSAHRKSEKLSLLIHSFLLVLQDKEGPRRTATAAFTFLFQTYLNHFFRQRFSRTCQSPFTRPLEI